MFQLQRDQGKSRQKRKRNQRKQKKRRIKKRRRVFKRKRQRVRRRRLRRRGEQARWCRVVSEATNTKVIWMWYSGRSTVLANYIGWHVRVGKAKGKRKGKKGIGSRVKKGTSIRKGKGKGKGKGIEKRKGQRIVSPRRFRKGKGIFRRQMKSCWFAPSMWITRGKRKRNVSSTLLARTKRIGKGKTMRRIRSRKGGMKGRVVSAGSRGYKNVRDRGMDYAAKKVRRKASNRRWGMYKKSVSLGKVTKGSIFSLNWKKKEKRIPVHVRREGKGKGSYFVRKLRQEMKRRKQGAKLFMLRSVSDRTREAHNGCKGKKRRRK